MSLVLSGVQPTGNLHLGNYLGALKNWVAFQDKMQCLFCIVDLHAITVFQDPKVLKDASRLTAAGYIASGIDPVKSSIFIQSSVSEHSELAWILSCITPLGWLNRMTQFKEKSGKNKDQSCLGLYSYPVLMAADILLYNTTHVPVGEDQKQHLELARDIAGAFNRLYNKDYFNLPEPMISGNCTRVMSLRDGTKKMSKSDESDYSRINLTDSADDIAKKIQKAKSDSILGISYDEEGRPEVSNLLNIFASLSDVAVEDLVEKYKSANASLFKKDLADLLVAKIMPINSKITELMQDSDYLDSIIRNGNERAKQIARQNLDEIKRLVGLWVG